MTDMAPASQAATEGLLQFPEGIPGFPESHRFQLTELAPDSAFQMFQSLDDPDVAMVVTMPWLFFPDYAPELSAGAQRELDVGRAEDAIVFCAVTLETGSDTVYVNLLAPFVVNAQTRQGRQVVLDDDQPLRAPVRLGA